MLLRGKCYKFSKDQGQGLGLEGGPDHQKWKCYGVVNVKLVNVIECRLHIEMVFQLLIKST